jgi:hypothetical protein
VSELTRLTAQADRFLEHYHNTEEANAIVMRAMSKWYAMVNLATDRAIEELYVPENVIPMQPRGWTIDYGNEPA